MKKTTLTLTLGVLGWVLSYAMFVKWLMANGWDFFGAWRGAFSAHDFATGLLIDLVVTSFMLVALAVSERRRLGLKWSAAVIASLALSVSVSLAVFLIATWRCTPQEEDSEPSLVS